MPKKEPETIDRVKFWGSCSLERYGFVLAALAKEEVADFGYEVESHVMRFKERKTHEVSAEECAAEFVKANPRFKSADMVAHFREAGREPSAAYYSIKKLADANVVRKSVGGEYVRVEALAPPAPKASKVVSRRGSNSKPYDVPNKELIARAIKGRKHITVSELRELFVREKRPEKSISPILSTMVKAKVIKQIGVGQYDVVPKKPTPEKIAAAAPAMTNGNGVLAHG
jgi:hypothetical protein